MTQKTHLAETDIFGDAAPVPDLAELEYRGRRLAEGLEGLRKTEAHYAAEAAAHEAAVAELTERLANATSTDRGGAQERLDIRRSLGEHQYEADVLRYELRLLGPQLAAQPALIEGNKKAIAAARAAQ
jgi:hypothetical protein